MSQEPRETYTMLVYTFLHALYVVHILLLSHQDALPVKIDKTKLQPKMLWCEFKGFHRITIKSHVQHTQF